MKAVVHADYGAPEDVLTVQDRPRPNPRDNEVLIDVRAAGINWADWSMVVGEPYLMRLGYGLRRPRSALGGFDVAGVVAEAGPKVSRFAVGDEVFGNGRSAFAEFACAKESILAHKPAQMSFEQAAATPMAGMVALQALEEVGNLEEGQKLLVNGASGGIGSFAVQIGKALGAEVTGICSTPNLDFVKGLGADEVIDYTVTDFTELPTKYDVILDMADRHSISDRRRVLNDGGTLIPNSGHGGPWFGSVGRIVKARLMSPFVGHNLKPFLQRGSKDDLETLVSMFDSGAVEPQVGRVFELSDAPEAIAYVGDGHARGKAVFAVN